MPTVSPAPDPPTRARDIGLHIGTGTPGPFNTITDVSGVRVGHTTLITGDGRLNVGQGPVRTGVTVVVPREAPMWEQPVFAAAHALNGNGELTGLEWVRESGLLTTPVAITNTHSVGVVRDALVAASIDVMSGGRFELGLGAGGFWDAVEGMGGTVRQKGERLPALEEAIGIIRAALDVGPERRVVRSESGLYPAHMYPAGPPPAHRIEIWIGAMSPGALRLIGGKADGWVPGAGILRAAEFPQLNTMIDEAASAAGRDPRQIRRVANIWGSTWAIRRPRSTC